MFFAKNSRFWRSKISFLSKKPQVFLPFFSKNRRFLGKIAAYFGKYHTFLKIFHEDRKSARLHALGGGVSTKYTQIKFKVVQKLIFLGRRGGGRTTFPLMNNYDYTYLYMIDTQKIFSGKFFAQNGVKFINRVRSPQKPQVFAHAAQDQSQKSQG